MATRCRRTTRTVGSPKMEMEHSRELSLSTFKFTDDGGHKAIPVLLPASSHCPASGNSGSHYFFIYSSPG